MADLTSMLTNLGPSLPKLQLFLSGFAYVMGVVFFIFAVEHMKDLVDKRAMYGSKAVMLVPLAYLMGGAALLFLPSTIDVLEATLFGSSSPLAYSSTFEEYAKTYADPTYVVTLLIQTGGLLWFIRGCTILVKSSKPKVGHGPKGMAFLLAGILAMNFVYTAEIVSATAEYITSKSHFLYPITPAEK